ncbi:unnamed protein product, partial [Amoebophrya sp. A25]
MRGSKTVGGLSELRKVDIKLRTAAAASHRGRYGLVAGAGGRFGVSSSGGHDRVDNMDVAGAPPSSLNYHAGAGSSTQNVPSIQLASRKALGEYTYVDYEDQNLLAQQGNHEAQPQREPQRRNDLYDQQQHMHNINRSEQGATGSAARTGSREAEASGG